jgi:hypothetical protein
VIGAIVGFGFAPTLVTLGSSALGGEAHLAMALAITGVATALISFAGFGLATLGAPRRLSVAESA